MELNFSCPKNFEPFFFVSGIKHATVNGDSSWPQSGGCKQGWIKYGKGCYLKVGGYTETSDGKDDLRNFNDANTYCGGIWQGGTLAVLPNRYYSFFNYNIISFMKLFRSKQLPNILNSNL